MTCTYCELCRQKTKNLMKCRIEATDLRFMKRDRILCCCSLCYSQLKKSGVRLRKVN